MKKILYILLLCGASKLFPMYNIYWTQDRPFVTLPPMPNMVYRPPSNPQRTCPDGHCDYKAAEAAEYKDITDYIDYCRLWDCHYKCSSNECKMTRNDILANNRCKKRK